MLLALAISINEYRLALAFAPPTVSANSQLRLPTNGRLVFSTGLESSGQVSVSRKRTSLGHCSCR